MASLTQQLHKIVSRRAMVSCSGEAKEGSFVNRTGKVPKNIEEFLIY